MTTPTPLPVPHAITRQDDGIRIEWDRAGHEGFYPAQALRLACPCAACVEEMSGRPLLDPATVDPAIRPVSLRWSAPTGFACSGATATRPASTPFRHLFDVCPCPACRSRRGLAAR